MSTGVWAVVPVKRLAVAKQRLAAALGAQREEFAYLLASRTLDLLAGASFLDGIIVVTADPRVAAAARGRGAVVIDDEERALNDACSRGLEVAAERGARITAVLPCDLPTLTAGTLAELLEEFRAIRDRCGEQSVGLVRCKQGSGTNLVLVGAARAFRPAFGPGSFERHRQACAGAAHELVAPEVSFDVDTVEDLELLATTIGGARARDGSRGWAVCAARSPVIDGGALGPESPAARLAGPCAARRPDDAGRGPS